MELMITRSSNVHTLETTFCVQGRAHPPPSFPVVVLGAFCARIIINLIEFGCVHEHRHIILCVENLYCNFD